MASFDPYHKWLGIPPEQQPPSYYRLLGIPEYESDLDVIESAADRQMIYLRTFQAGPNYELAERLLNEVSEARVWLMDGEAKVKYDRLLREGNRPTLPPVSSDNATTQGHEGHQSATAPTNETELPGPARPSLPFSPESQPFAVWKPKPRAPESRGRGTKPIWQQWHILLIIIGVVGISLFLLLALGPGDNEAKRTGLPTEPGIAPVNGQVGLIEGDAVDQRETDTEPSVEEDGGMPALAIVPFDATAAKVYQRTWANSMGVTTISDPELIDVITPFSNSSRTQSIRVPEGTSRVEIGIIRGDFTKQNPAWKHAGKLGVLTVNNQVVLRYVKSYTAGDRKRHTLFSAIDGTQPNTRLGHTMTGLLDITQLAKEGEELVVTYRHKQINPRLGVRVRFYHDIPSVVTTNSIGMKFHLIPPGAFQMRIGKLVEDAVIKQPFFCGTHEVTQAQYERVMGSNPSRFKGATLPIENVTWSEASEFCQKLSDQEGVTYRLPLEMEWEYACRAGTRSAWSHGDDERVFGDYAWYAGNSGGMTHPVGTKAANPWGLYDMHGNVWEWCQDRYHPSGEAQNAIPSTVVHRSWRVNRGGSWNGAPGFSRSDRRGRAADDERFGNSGFRVVRELSSPAVVPENVSLEAGFEYTITEFQDGRAFGNLDVFRRPGLF